MLRDMTVYLSDCLDGMTEIDDGSIDMVLSDLPYSLTGCQWDTPIDLSRLWEGYRRVVKPDGAILLFAASPFDKVLACSNFSLFRYEWIWEKSNATGFLNVRRMPLKSHENILVFYEKQPQYHPQMSLGHSPVHKAHKKAKPKGVGIYGEIGASSVGGSTERFPRTVLRFPSDKQTVHLHPTQKPVALLSYLIRTYTSPGELVLDSCMGSGSTAIAAMACDRRFIGFETDPSFHAICMERIGRFRQAISGIFPKNDKDRYEVLDAIS